jgi:hypothetical protein
MKTNSNMAKNEFAWEEMDFLRHILLQEGVRLDLEKLEAIRVWKKPIMVKGI